MSSLEFLFCLNKIEKEEGAEGEGQGVRTKNSRGHGQGFRNIVGS